MGVSPDSTGAQKLLGHSLDLAKAVIFEEGNVEYLNPFVIFKQNCVPNKTCRCKVARPVESETDRAVLWVFLAKQNDFVIESLEIARINSPWTTRASVGRKSGGVMTAKAALARRTWSPNDRERNLTDINYVTRSIAARNHQKSTAKVHWCELLN